MQRLISPVWKIVLLAAAVMLPAATPARAWWNAEWTMRKRVTIDTGPVGAGVSYPLAGVPVLVRLHDGNFPFASVKADGSDLRFIAADDKTPLMFHLEKFDSLLNEAFVWVNLPELQGGTQTTFWLYFGNTSGAAARVDNVKGTYDSDTVLVYHFAERGQPAADASGNNNNSTAAAPAADGAMIGGGLRLDGRTALTIPASPSLAWSDGASLTWSAWIKLAAAERRMLLFRRESSGNSFVVGFDSGAPFVEVTRAGAVQRTSVGPPTTLPLGSWHHLAVTASGSSLTLFLDGEPYGTVGASLPALDAPSFLGGDGAAGSVGFVGEIDELQVSRDARLAAFLKFTAAQQGGEKAARVLLFGEEEQPKSWLSFLKGGYLGVIIGSLSFDGWVVIGVLGIMFVISWAVMIGKALYLGRVGKGNELFLEEWRHVATDLSVLDDVNGDKAKSVGGRIDGAAQRIMHAAPLYRVYHIGVEEIRHRLVAERKSRALSARSIQAIRAALDGGLVRETHRLSSQMVLLTIAISGGPFLGLLGTVVGVMITFAAVAAAGEVNVNAIAPGIAAALAATVAGLAVAIPALFGYNYLLTRIKATTSDMHVFIDEFVAKMAEFYSEEDEAERTAAGASPATVPVAGAQR